MMQGPALYGRMSRLRATIFTAVGTTRAATRVTVGPALFARATVSTQR